MSEPTVILSAVRTPWGRLLGSLSDVSATELGGMAAREAVRAAGIPAEEIERAFLGNVLADGTRGNPAGAACRSADLTAGTAALTVRAGCASGLAALALAVDVVASGRAPAVLAGGFESSSGAPHLAGGLRRGLRLGNTKLRDSARHDGPMALDPEPGEDRRRHAAAVERGWSDGEILAVDLPRPRKGQPPRVEADDPPADTPVLPHLADGAAAVVIASGDWTAGRGLTPLCRVEPVARPMESAGDYSRIHADLPGEGWSALLAAVKGPAGEVINPDGGGSAMGHAAGADGARLAVAMVHALRRGGAERGMALAGDPHEGLYGLAFGI